MHMRACTVVFREKSHSESSHSIFSVCRFHIFFNAFLGSFSLTFLKKSLNSPHPGHFRALWDAFKAISICGLQMMDKNHRHI